MMFGDTKVENINLINAERHISIQDVNINKNSI